MTTRLIPIAQIDAEDRLRVLDPAWVALLAEEIQLDGLLEPIRVVERGERFRLVAGARRIAAHIHLGRTEIKASIADAKELADADAVRLAEIKSNMLRGDLSALDRAVYIATWCDIYRDGVEPAKPGRKRASEQSAEDIDELSAKLAPNWTEAAQNALQIGRRSIFRSLSIARIDADIRRAIALHPIADRQSELLLLADQTPPRQAAIIAKLLAEPIEAHSITDAIALLDQRATPKELTVAEKLSQRFVVLKAAEQEKFFDLHAEAIEKWLAKRAVTSTKARASHLKSVA